jgi:hypothetical protein
MTYQEYLKSQGYTDAEITSMVTTFGADKISKAFEAPMRAAEAAARDLAAVKTEREEFQTFYETDVLPKIGQTYQDAINSRTENAALKERLAAATEYGFLSDPKHTVVPGATPPAAQVPGSPAAPGAPAAPDPRYVQADSFTKAVNDIPDMLGRMQNVSNQHFALFGNTDLDMTDLITEARKRKTNIQVVWEERYKVNDKRAELARIKTETHDKEVADAAVRKYASEHNMPFTAPGQVSRAPLFTPGSTTDDARHPWKGARERQNERKQKLTDALVNKGVPAARVQ